MKTKEVIIYILVTVIIVLVTIIIGKQIREKKEKIYKNGTYTVGTIVDRGVRRGNKGFPTASVCFDFYVGNKLVKHLSQDVSDKDYHNAIVGMKYEVIYLDEKPHINSIVHINKPVKTEYVNIEAERQRIKATYKNANVFLRKNARPLEEIQHLLK